MYELIQLSAHDYYIDSPTKIGVVEIGGGEVIVIDSGNDKDAGKKVYRILEDKGWHLRAIYNTHYHADHTGGNHFLQEKTGCGIYIHPAECAFVNHTDLEPTFLYGARPFKDLRHKFLIAAESDASELGEDVLPAGMKLLDLPGHSIGMTGFLTADGTAFIGDSVSSAETIAKYGIMYLFDADVSLDSLEKLKTVPAERFVPSHAPVTGDIRELADRNAEAISAVKEKILTFCREGMTFETLLGKVFDAYSIPVNPVEYVLIGSTIRSYLAGLSDAGLISFEFRENRMLWQTVGR